MIKTLASKCATYFKLQGQHLGKKAEARPRPESLRIKVKT